MRSRTGFLTAAEKALSACSGLVLFGMMLVGLTDVFCRYVLASPIPGAAEIAELALGVMVFTALPLVTARGEHVTVELIGPSSTSGGWLVKVQTLGVSLISAGIVGIMAWQLVITGQDFASYGDSSSFLGIPLAPVAWVMAAMAALSALILLVQGIAAVLPAVLPRPEDAAKAAPSLHREVT